MSAAVTRKLQQAEQQLKHGDIDGAALSCEEVLRRAPRNPEALWLLGMARLMAQRIDEAIPLFERVLAAAPNHGAALENLGLAHLMRADYATAEHHLRKAAAHPAAPASVFMRLGLALLHQGNGAEAVTQLEHARSLQPANLDVRASLGRAYASESRWSDARREFEHVHAQAPNDPDTLYNLGIVSVEEGAPDAALSWFDQCLARAPQHLDALERRAMLYLALGRFPQAADDLRVVLAARAPDPSALLALAEASFQCGALDEAFETAAKARDLDPAASGPYSLIAQMHHVQGALDKAVDVLEQGYARTRADALLGALVHLTHRQCDWRRWKPAWEHMSSRLEDATDLGSPFWLLQENTTPAQQLAYTRRWVAHSYAASTNALRPMQRQPKSAGERWRIGYYSGDFHQHPVACLVVEALELHDRERFEVFAYSYGPDDGSEMRSRLVNGIEHFVDVAWEPNDVVLKRIRSDRLHLLIDLKGYTAGDRLRVMAERPCAVQAAWLGYPATSGAPFIDYVIADDYIIRGDAEQHYSERVLRLPHSYQANDRKRRAAPPHARADYGLPEGAFVFCCFNQTVKITPQIFERWMSLLRRVDGSVLWLLDDNTWATRNLRQSVKEAGIAGERVVIGPRLPPAEHLARYRVADLALDTFPYTSHTTGSDALWLGCPLVALSGETFASRVSGSLLVNCGLPELITRTLDEYEGLAVRLANDGAYMREVRARLAATRESAPLFDSQRFARDLEALYVQIMG
jgi:predicted O-linked N-acetylglucosamine transferase (SPINDLY family)